MGGLNWGAGLRSLAEVMQTALAGQEEQRQAETLRQLFDQQRQQLEAERIRMGLTEGPPVPAGFAVPSSVGQPQPQAGGGLFSSLGGALTGFANNYAAGLTQGSPDIDVMRYQLQTGGGELAQMRTLAGALQRAKMEDQLQRDLLQYKNQMPMPAARQQEIEARAAQQKALQEFQAQQQAQALAAQAAKQRELEMLRFQNDMRLRGVPQATAPGWQEKLFQQMSPEQRQRYIDAQTTGGGASLQEQLFSQMSPEQKQQYVQRMATGMPEERILPAGEIDKLSTLSSLLSEADLLGQMDVDAYAGPAAGRAGKLKETFGMLGDDETQFRRISANIADQLLRARSGAAITESEFTRMSKIVPQPTDSAPQFRAKLKDFRREMGNLYGTKLNLLKSAGYRVPDEMLQPQAQSSPQAQSAPMAPTPNSAPAIRIRRDANGNLIAE